MSDLLKGLSFEEASKHARYFKRAIRRESWEAFVSYTPDLMVNSTNLWGYALNEYFGNEREVVIEGHFTLKTGADTVVTGWQPTTEDYFANDWQVINPVTGEILSKNPIQKDKP